jgi:hypothetical protein
MSDCCSTNQDVRTNPKRFTCPENNQQYLEVPFVTVLHHVNEPWQLKLKDQAYYFCNDPNCDVVYIGIDNTTITKSMVRTKVGIKESTDDALICYCFGVTKAEAKSNKQAQAFVVEQTKNARCSCETSNPSGRCCLKVFPK